MDLRNAVVVVTGGTGYLGGHVCRRLHDAGAMPRPLARRGGPGVLAGDVRDRSVLLEACRGADLVVHLAVSPGYRSEADPIFDAEVNTLGTLNVLTAAQEANLRKVVIGSTSHVYGAGPSPMSEGGDLRPSSFYGVSKLAGEMYATFFARTRHLSTLVLRMPILYGPAALGASPPNVVARMTELALQGAPLTLHGDPGHELDLLHVSDAADGVMLALRADLPPGEIVNLGSGESITLHDLATAIVRAAGSGSAIQVDRSATGSRLPLLDITKARRLLGFHPRVRTIDGVRDYVLSLGAVG